MDVNVMHTSDSSPFLALASALAAAGIPLFPCKATDKTPFVAGGFKAASTDPAQIAAWAREFPGALVGVPTGERSGFDVVDVDPRNGGTLWYDAHRDRLPATRVHQTRSGGWHYFFRHLPGLRCSAGNIAPGIDVRADGGYAIWWGGSDVADLAFADLPDWLAVAAARACYSGKPKDPKDHKALAPEHLTAADLVALVRRMLNYPEANRDRYMLVLQAISGARHGIIAWHGDLLPDEETDIRNAAVDWALRHADPEHRGTFDEESHKWETDWKQRGDLAGWGNLIGHAVALGMPDACKLAAEIDQRGGDRAAEQAQQEWTAEDPPPGYDSAHVGTGAADEMPDFDAMRQPKISELGLWDAGEDSYTDIPPREWLLGNVFCRGFLSSLLADGGTGKTALRLAQCIAMATQRAITGEYVFQRCRVLFISLEDDRDELRRRVAAVLKFHGIDPAEIKGWLHLAAPKGLKLAHLTGGSFEIGALEKLIRMAIAEYKLDVVVLDPFVKSHGVPENDNNAVDQVATLLTKIAIELHCAVDAPHHTRKGTHEAGDAAAGRGAASYADAGRLVYSLVRMTPAEAQQFEISETDRRGYVRMDNAKVNLAPASRDTVWFRLTGVPLGNGTDTYPNGDNVQTVQRWQPPNIWHGMDEPTMRAILKEIDAGLPNGSRYSNHNRAGKRAAALAVQKHLPEHTDEAARQVITAWLKSGLLIEKDYEDTEDRKTRKGLFVNKEKAGYDSNEAANG